eukprot:jgi/Tetstr1/426741/TSEL_001678.t1
MDESMSAYQPRATKLGGLPNLSFIYRKPKPLGTEMKTAAVQVGKMGRHFIGVVKSGHGMFPNAFLKSHLTSAPAGSRVALSAIVDGLDLMALGYKYNMRKVLFFVATAGAGALEDGNPFIQRWADDFGNTVTRSIPRPSVLSNYFERSPRVDNHN